MNIKLVGLDLDGTVLNSQKQVSERTKQAIESAARQGVEIAYVTGRPLSGIDEAVRNIEGIRYAITSNGAVTYDLQTDTILHGKYIEKAVAKEIIRIPMERKLLHNVFIHGLGYSNRTFYEQIMQCYEGRILYDYVKRSRRWADDIFRFMDETADGIENIWIRTNAEVERRDILEQLQQYPELRIVTTCGTDIEMGNAASDKGLAFLELAAELGIEQRCTLAIGDDENDMGMLREAGVAVAMGNALTLVKNMCQWVTEDNDNDGVALVLEKILV
ncbi:MAG: Cof-type HAD-IIB family hydrolase [Lachnospiraceae bacterium]|nr:Cof-type HAD-IIB family hydrolase [Lachnospiraceae bacterium]